jgi:hypothetical protein
MKALMEKEGIDLEKDCLVVHRDKQGSFRYFRWYSGDRVTRNDVKAQIIKWNKSQEQEEDGYPAELITNRLVREICAYKEHGTKLEDLIRKAKEVQECIDQAKEYLETAMENIDGIRGLD